jgi:hypothetical protein
VYGVAVCLGGVGVWMVIILLEYQYTPGLWSEYFIGQLLIGQFVIDGMRHRNQRKLAHLVLEFHSNSTLPSRVSIKVVIYDTFRLRFKIVIAVKEDSWRCD